MRIFRITSFWLLFIAMEIPLFLLLVNVADVMPKDSDSQVGIGIGLILFLGLGASVASWVTDKLEWVINKLKA